MTGTKPFIGDSAAEIASKQKTEVPPDPRGFNSQIPYEVAQLILRCLKKRKEERFDNPGLLAAELRSLEHFLPIVEYQAPEIQGTTKSQTISFQKRWGILAAAVVIIISKQDSWPDMPGTRPILPIIMKQ